MESEARACAHWVAGSADGKGRRAPWPEAIEVRR